MRRNHETKDSPSRQNLGYLGPSVAKLVMRILESGPLFRSERIFFDSGIELVIPTKLKQMQLVLDSRAIALYKATYRSRHCFGSRPRR